MKRIFISSTGKDLAEYRLAAIETCQRMGMAPIAMEFFEALGVGANDASKQKMDAADLFVAIVAHRYGYIEPGFNKSVTENEFHYAGKKGLERICLVVDASHVWPPDAIDHEHYMKLDKFKKQIDRSVVRLEFTTIDDFQAKLTQSLAAWLLRKGGSPQCYDEAQTGSLSQHVPAPYPALILGRDEDSRAIKDRVIRVSDRKRLTIVQGWPGVGKTTLVTALAHDPQVIAAFPDGILWVPLGDIGDANSQLVSLGRQLGLHLGGGALTLEKSITQLRAALRNKRVLIIVDDVWRGDDAVPFKQVIGQHGSVLVTTRLTVVARTLADSAADIYRLSVLSQRSAIQLLSRSAPRFVKQNTERAERLVEAIECLPLAIRVAGRLLEAELDLNGKVTQLMDEFMNTFSLLRAQAPDDRFDPVTGSTPTIDLLLRRSTDLLERDERTRFCMLAVFAPKPATFDQDAMKFVWNVEDPLPTIRRFVDLGLLEPIPSVGRFQMHFILVIHAQSMEDKE